MHFSGGWLSRLEHTVHIREVRGSSPLPPIDHRRFVNDADDDFTVREMLEMVLGSDGKRKLRLRHKTNDELFGL